MTTVRYRSYLLISALIGVLLRLPFAWRTGLSMDEAGYVVIARSWQRGAKLYSPQAWIDRPQGLILIFRGLVVTGLDSPFGIRLLALVASGLLVFAVALVARGFGADRTTALVSAAAWAVIGAAPSFEGFTANGELLAAIPSTFAVALAANALLRENSSRRPLLTIALAGALGALGPLIKQSAFDGAVVCFVLTLCVTGPRLRRMVSLVAGAGVVVGASLGHGWVSGWGPYVHAIIGARTNSTASTLTGSVDRLVRVALAPGLVVFAAALIACFGLPTRPLVRRVYGLWIVMCIIGIMAGTFFWAHYFIQILVPLCVPAGWTLRRWSRTRPALWQPGVVVASLLALSIWRPSPFGVAIDPRTKELAAVVRVMVPKDEVVLGLWQPGAIAYFAGRPAGHKYLWATWFIVDPRAKAELVAVLGSPSRPMWVAQVQSPAEAADAISAGYDIVVNVDGALLLHRNDR